MRKYVVVHLDSFGKFVAVLKIYVALCMFIICINQLCGHNF